MKKNIRQTFKVKKSIKRMLLTIIAISAISSIYAQPKQLLNAIIIDAISYEAVPFANLALFDLSDASIKGGSSSCMEGKVQITSNNYYTGFYQLRISAVGYETLIDTVSLNKEHTLLLDTIFLPPSQVLLDDIMIVAERIKAKTDAGKTTFFVNQNMQNASNNGTDILKLIPGVSVDIRQNIALEGSQNIIILVNGVERDKSFISQLHSGSIDKIEVINTPPSKYDADITGVLNIILNKQMDKGIEGHLYVEIPTSDSEIYLFPNYSLGYSRNKLNLYTSYNGELSYFNIKESYNRTIHNNIDINEIISSQDIRQQYWSHRFHFGFDYFLNDRNQFNFYSFYNPYSNEHSGDVQLQTFGNTPESWGAIKEDKDMNHRSFYSLYYKHSFDKASDHELSADVHYYNFNGENITTYSNAATGYNQVNTNKPLQNSAGIKIDYALPINDNLKLFAGVQSKFNELKNKSSEQFRYNEETYAAYSGANFNIAKFEFQLGLRYEEHFSVLADSDRKINGLMPNATINYGFSSSQNLRLSYRRSISYPQLYLLNPVITISDPLTMNYGNPYLNPVLHNNLRLEHSKRFENSFVSTSLFYNRSDNVINNLTWINENGIFETQRNNLGDIYQVGVQVSGSLSITQRVGLNPYVRLFEIYTTPNSLALHHNVSKNNEFAYELGFSAYAVFNRDIIASVFFQYASPIYNLQYSDYTSALYFLSLEKSFGNGFKTGVVSGLPLARTFTYHGAEMQNGNFDSRSEGNIIMSAVPVWFKVSYQFATGRKIAKINRASEEIEKAPRKGF